MTGVLLLHEQSLQLVVCFVGHCISQPDFIAETQTWQEDHRSEFDRMFNKSLELRDGAMLGIDQTLYHLGQAFKDHGHSCHSLSMKRMLQSLALSKHFYVSSINGTSKQVTVLQNKLLSFSFCFQRLHK
jgi:hypothetical protein